MDARIGQGRGGIGRARADGDALTRARAAAAARGPHDALFQVIAESVAAAGDAGAVTAAVADLLALANLLGAVLVEGARPAGRVAAAAGRVPAGWLAVTGGDGSAAETALLADVARVGWAALDRIAAADAAARREGDARFLLGWSDAVRGLIDPQAVGAETLARLAAHLDAVACVFAEEAGGWRWAGGQVAPFAGAVAPDWLAVPLVHDGVPVGVLAVEGAGGRRWQPGEQALVAELASRLCETLAQARAGRRRDNSEALLSAFMERAPLGMYVKDAAGRFIRFNPELAAALGRPGDAMAGRHAAEFLPAAIADRLERLDVEARSGATVSAEVSDHSRDHHRTLIAVAFPVSGAGEAHTGGFTIDLTDRKAAEAELARSREALHQTEKLSALGSLLAGVSHELNNPLSIVTAQADLIAYEVGDGPLARRAAKLREAADRCARIVRTFLAMARRQDPVRRSVDINAVAGAALDLVGYGLTVDGITIERRLGERLPPVEADADQLHQIVVNLLVNAQHALAGTAQRRVTVTTRAEAHALVLEVADNGPGVPEPVRRRIFEPFYTTKPQGQGTGMGLAFSQGLAEAHGGTLSLAEPADGAAGATFRLTLPFARTPDAATRLAMPTRSASKSRYALVVDGDRAAGEALASLLGREGYQTRVVDNGSAAQALLGTGQFDLVVSEMRMPGVDGPALWRWVQRLRPELCGRMVFATGDLTAASTVAFLREAGRPCLEKPAAFAAVRDMLTGVEGR